MKHLEAIFLQLSVNKLANWPKLENQWVSKAWDRSYDMIRLIGKVCVSSVNRFVSNSKCRFSFWILRSVHKRSRATE